jgi:hypothetical protein
VPVATAEDILIMKVMAGRAQDQQDVHGIVTAHGNELDWSYCGQVAQELGDALGLDLAAQIKRLQSNEDSI